MTANIVYDPPAKPKALEILKYPASILLQKAHPIRVEGVEPIRVANGALPLDMTREELSGLIENMRDTAAGVEWGKAVGLAAPQIGRSVRLILVHGTIYLNPCIVWVSKKITLQREGCYSLKANKFDYEAPRAHSIDLIWQDIESLTLATKKKRFHRAEAQVFQHAIGHLEGWCCGTKAQLAELS